MEEISDWITKILVGVGLVQLGQVPGAIMRLGDILKPSLGNQPSSAVVGVSLVLYSGTISFLLMYMWTRIRFLDVINGRTPPAVDAAPAKSTQPSLPQATNSTEV